MDTEQKRKQHSLSVEKGIILCVPYACNIGGTATLSGTFPNLVLQEYWVSRYPNSPITLNYSEWLGYGLLNSALLVLCLYLFMSCWFVGFRCQSNPAKDKVNSK